APTEGYGEAIVILEILVENFEIKMNLLQLVQANKFHGFERDNPHTHISNFKRMTATLKYRDVSNDAIKLMLFPYSLEGAARIWYEKEPPNSILTWDDLVNNFVNQFFPPSKTTHLKNKISRFTQRFEEAFGEAWDRFKEMLRACPHHGFSKLTQIDTFYNGLTEQDQDSLNAAVGGNLLNKTTREALKIIENKSKPSTSGTLPSKTVPNPKGEMKAVTTQSGLAYEGPSIPTNSPLEKVDEQNTEEILDKEHSNSSGSTAQVQPPVMPISISEPDVSRTQTKPTIPYPSSFTDALLLMPKFASTIKSLLANKDKLFELAKGWRTNPHSDIELADRSITHLKGVAEDVFVKVGKFYFLTDFMVVDFEADPRVPLILGRSFLRTVRALIDVYGEEITLRVNDKSVTFNLNQTMRYSSTYDDNSVNRVDVIDIACEEFVQDVLDFHKEPIVKSSSPTLTPFGESNLFLEEIKDFLNDDSIPTGIENSVYDLEGDILFLEKLLNEDPFQLPPIDLKLAEESKVKSFVEEPPELELKELPSHLEYAFLEDSNKLPISDIKGIDSRFCTHKILMEDDYKPAVQSQRRVNPKIHDVIKKEVIKLLDAGMIYPISDGSWVSPIHCVPKKGDYRKLNDATRKDHFPLPFMDQMLESKTDDKIDKLADQISNLLEIVNKQVIALAKAVEKTCVTYGGAHAYYECIATDSNQSSVCVATGSYNQVSLPNRASHQIPPLGFAPVQNNPIRFNQNQGQGNYFNQANNFNQGNNFKENNFQNNQGYRAQMNNASNFQNQGSFFQNQPSTSGTLPSKTVPNPKGEMKAVTTRSGLAYEGPSIPTNSPLEKVDEQNTEEILDKEHSNSSGSTAQVQPPSLLANKDKLFELAKVSLNENCSTMLLKKLPEKLEDPGKFLIPCDFPEMEVSHALADLGASINLMPLLIWKKLSLPELTLTRMTIELADRSITHLKGVAEDVFVKVGKFYFLTDFMVVDFEADPRVPLVSGRSFLRTVRALIDVYGEEITLRVNDKSVTFNLNQTMRYSSTYDDNSVNRVDVIDIACEEFVQDVLDFHKEPIVKSSSPTLTPFGESNLFLEEIKDFLNDDSIPTGIENSVYDLEGDILFLEKLLNEDPFQLPPIDLKLAEESKVKSFVEEPPELELKKLSSHLEVCIDYRKLNDATRKDHFPLPFMDQMLERRKLLSRDLMEPSCTDACYLACVMLRDFSKIARPMTHLLEKETPFVFSKECIDAFNTLKKKITEAPILVVPDWNLPFELMCDASDYAIGKKLLTSSKLAMRDLLGAIMVQISQRRSEALPTNDARVVVKFLKSLFSRFGIPRAIISDRGTHFCNDQFTRVMIKYGVTHRLATAYHPQTSGQVEALKHVNFDLKTTGGHRKLQLNELSELRDQAYENSVIYKERTKRLHDSKIKNRISNVGDQVLLFNSRLKIFSGKLKTRWSCPFTITRVFAYGTIELSQPNGPNFKENGHHVKHYFGGDIPSNVAPDLHTFPMDN
nr:reverse transcriptase domain-containing protein [Tanacetum cinerariifolium]